MSPQPNKRPLTQKDVPAPGLTAWRWQWWLVGVVVLSLLAVVADAGVAWAHRSWPTPYVVKAVASFRQDGLPLAWPSVGAAAVGAVGDGVLAVTGADTPRAMASTAKLITALTVLQKAPLSPGQSGPTLTVTPAIAATFGQYYLVDGSEVPLTAGEQINEYQALQALLIPSADDIADALADWFYGTISHYLAAANLLVRQLGMTETVVSGDASGFLPSSVSTPDDLVLLGEAALANPVIASIVGQKSMTMPDGLTETSTDQLLGVDGIEGIKTGNTDAAGGVFVFAAEHPVGTQTVTVVGAVMGAPTLEASFAESRALLASAEANFAAVTPVQAGQVLATYHVAWQKAVQVVAEHDLSTVAWLGETIQPTLTLQAIHPPLSRNGAVGVVSIDIGPESSSSPVELRGRIAGPPRRSLSRLFRR
ncbi:MAG TPA: hypothetical protein VHA57_01780 [Actinomycetota bacterium]|nr:hypothetical protein [Actinomycetota bacterium]